MKKIFTMISAILLAGGFAMNAEKVTCDVSYWNGKTYADAQSFETELTMNSDGVLMLADFLNSGAPVYFTFAEPDVNGYSAIELKGNLDTTEAYPYLLTPDESYMFCSFTPDGSDAALPLNYPYVFTGVEDSYVYRYDMSDPENVCEYFGCFSLSGWDDSDAQEWVSVTFFFNKPEAAEESEVIGSTPIDMYVDFWNEEAYDYVQAAKNISTELEFNSDGSYTIKDFCNSGVPVTFTNGEYTTDPDYGTYSSISYANISKGYLLNPETDANDLVCKVFPVDGGDDDFITLNTIYMGSAFLYKYEKSDPDYIADYYASLAFCGKLADGNWSDYYYLGFYFNAPDTSGVSEAEVDENAPVEYFNLQGVKVANPENGIFIRRQGKEVKKIMVR